jgi:hypothetical protein
MSTQLATINLDSPQALVPAYLQNLHTRVFTNISSGFGRNRISLKGNRFRLIVDNQEESVIETNYLDVIIVGLTSMSEVSRMYFEGTYNADVKANPVCYSTNGIKPNDDVKIKQSDKCAMCPQNEKGSRANANDGFKSRACQMFKRVAVILPEHPDRVFQLDCKPMSLWAESRPNENKYCLRDYLAKFKTRGHDPAHAITRLSFDTEYSVPKLLFSAAAWIPQELVSTVVELTESDEVKTILEITASTVDFASESDKSTVIETPAKVASVTPIQSQTKPTTVKVTQGPSKVAKAPAPVPTPTVSQTNTSTVSGSPLDTTQLNELLAQLGVDDGE